MISPETLTKYAILPRLFMLCTTVLTYQSATWFMSLESPSAAQASFVSIISGCASGVFAIWINKEVK